MMKLEESNPCLLYTSPQTAAYGHCQVTVFFIGKFPDDAVGHREAGGQAASRQVAVGEGLLDVYKRQVY